MESNHSWIDPLVILDRQRVKTDALHNILAGRSVFLVGGGPSADDLPLELINGRGLWSLAINNVAGHKRLRPQAMVCSDPPAKFSHSIWLDPGIMKFVPTPKLTRRSRGQLRVRTNGEFHRMDKTILDCPNVWGFQRYSWLTPDDSFFKMDGCLWGNNDDGVTRTGQPKTVCTMLLGLRLLHYLGAKRVYLIGVDFRMTSTYGYSFSQERDEGAARSNNHLFSVVNTWLVTMRQDGVFERAGMEVYNCYRNSGLRAFDYVPFELAVQESKGIVEDVPDLTDWYGPRN